MPKLHTSNCNGSELELGRCAKFELILVNAQILTEAASEKQG